MTPVPPGFRLRADARTRRYDGHRVLAGGSPRRVLRLTDSGADVARRLLDGAPVQGPAESALARRLLDAGLAHPLPPATHGTVEVVVPVYADVVSLARCLAALGNDLPVTVVDDGSPDADAVRATAAEHGATVLRLADNRGPAAARNAGARAAVASVVAFVDSDVVVPAATLSRLAAHLADETVAAVAPRVRAAGTSPQTVLGRFAATSSPLDIGPDSSLAAPGRRVSYVPSTVLLLRRTTLLEVGGFDESLRLGEDVDLVWRLDAAGHRIRYDADVHVHHAEPQTWASWLRRRFRYGTSAATLALRHGGGPVSLSMQPAPFVTVVLAVLGRPRLAAAVAAGTTARMGLRARGAGVPALPVATAAAVAPAQSALAAARWITQLWAPALVVAAAGSRRRRRAVAVAAAAPPLLTWAVRRPRLDPARWVLASWADDVAYGLGVWAGCIRHRTVRPLVPRIGGRDRQEPAGRASVTTATSFGNATGRQ